MNKVWVLNGKELITPARQVATSEQCVPPPEYEPGVACGGCTGGTSPKRFTVGPWSIVQMCPIPPDFISSMEFMPALGPVVCTQQVGTPCSWYGEVEAFIDCAQNGSPPQRVIMWATVTFGGTGWSAAWSGGVQRAFDCLLTPCPPVCDWRAFGNSGGRFGTVDCSQPWSVTASLPACNPGVATGRCGGTLPVVAGP